MIGILAVLQVQPDKVAAFEAIFARLAARVRAEEPGALLYQLTRSRTEPLTYKVLELYADQAAVEAHAATDYYKAIGAELGPCLTAPPAIELLDAIEA